MSPRDAARVLTLLLGARVRRWERPIAYAASPHLLTGVDCRLPTFTGTKSRAVGTAVSRATITGGHLLQGSTCLQVVAGAATRRLPWSHYLSRPGMVEVIGRVDRADLVRGFVAAGQPAGTLDLGAISGRVMDSVQQSSGLDRRPPFRMARTRLRWAAEPAGDGTEVAVRFTIEDETLRTVRLRLPADPPDHAGPPGQPGQPGQPDHPDQRDRLERIAEVAEDLALHDWLLTTILRIIERSRIGAEPPGRIVESLRPAIDHLLHLWMPAARLDQPLGELWESLERNPGFTRQWNVSVARIRDQVAVATLAPFGSAQGSARRA